MGAVAARVLDRESRVEATPKVAEIARLCAGPVERVRGQERLGVFGAVVEDVRRRLERCLEHVGLPLRYATACPSHHGRRCPSAVGWLRKRRTEEGTPCPCRGSSGGSRSCGTASRTPAPPTRTPRGSDPSVASSARDRDASTKDARLAHPAVRAPTVVADEEGPVVPHRLDEVQVLASVAAAEHDVVHADRNVAKRFDGDLLPALDTRTHRVAPRTELHRLSSEKPVDVVRGPAHLGVTSRAKRGPGGARRRRTACFAARATTEDCSPAR